MRKKLAVAMCGGLLAAVCFGDIAHAQDFFSSFFGGGYSRRAERSYYRTPYASEYDDDYNQGYGRSARRSEPSGRASTGSGQAFCVRTCDGRYFPISSQGDQSKAEARSNFCPSSETKIFYGSSIDIAYAENGKRYNDLPNAFKYRTSLIAGCTCNGQPTGLAPIKIDDDPTLKRGDIVAGADGLMINRGSDKRGAMNFSPVSSSIRSKYSQARATDD